MRDATRAEGDESEVRNRYHAITLTLAQERVTEGRPLRDVLQTITETVADALQVQRVSVWFFLDERRSIRCDYLYQPERKDIYEGAVLHACDFPEYFRVLESSRVVRFVDRDGD